jgi:DNA-directed RNA polymerase subunit RPC12/RpoP
MKETMQCPKCGKGNLIKAGHALEPGKGRVQQYRCKDCGRSTTKPLIQYRDDKGHFIPNLYDKDKIPCSKEEWAEEHGTSPKQQHRTYSSTARNAASVLHAEANHLRKEIGH